MVDGQENGWMDEWMDGSMENARKHARIQATSIHLPYKHALGLDVFCLYACMHRWMGRLTIITVL